MKHVLRATSKRFITDQVNHPVAELNETRCATCHKEHNAPSSLTRLNDSLCVDYHSDIQTFDPNTELLNASHFEDDHPEFKATLFKPDNSGETIRVNLSTPKILLRPAASSLTIRCIWRRPASSA